MFKLENRIVKLIMFIPVIYFPQVLLAQHLQTNLCGEYVSKNAMYDNFTFRFTGQVWNNASLMDTPRDYFQYNDTVVIYPDKDVFRFILQKNGTLKGISEWVKDSIWVKIPNDTFTCFGEAKVNTIKLQQMYTYEQMMQLAVDKNKVEANSETIMTTLQKLCDSGYGRACYRLGLYTKYLVENGTQQCLLIWEKGCKNNDAICCRLLADEYRKLNKTEMALKYYNISCKLGDFEACANDIEDNLKKPVIKKSSKQNNKSKKRKK
jgi:hypothetical protein